MLLTITNCYYKIIIKEGKEGGAKMTQQSIRQIRQGLNLKQCEVAQKVGISNNYLTMIENGLRNPGDTLKQKLCDLYGIDMNTLFLALKVTKCD